MNGKETLGNFLRQKVSNMRDWIKKETHVEINIPVTDINATMLAVRLTDEYEAIEKRDWPKLLLELEKEETPEVLRRAVLAVHTQDELHDKFWRYLALFASALGRDKI